MLFAVISLPSAAQGKGGLGRERYVREREARMKSQDSQRFTEFRQRKLDRFSEGTGRRKARTEEQEPEEER